MRHPFAEKIFGVSRRPFPRDFRVIRLFPRRRAGDAVIFDAGIRADAAADIGLNVVEIEVLPDVAVEFAVIRIARKALFRRPNLLGAALIAPERRHARRRVDRRMHAVKRGDAGVIDPDGFHEEKAHAFAPQNLIYARIIGALRQPHPFRAKAENAFKIVQAGNHLRFDGFRLRGQQRQKAMRGSGGDQLHASAVVQVFEGD